jgi:hypothetical protein
MTFLRYRRYWDLLDIPTREALQQRLRTPGQRLRTPRLRYKKFWAQLDPRAKSTVAEAARVKLPDLPHPQGCRFFVTADGDAILKCWEDSQRTLDRQFTFTRTIAGDWETPWDPGTIRIDSLQHAVKVCVGSDPKDHSQFYRANAGDPRVHIRLRNTAARTTAAVKVPHRE